MSQRESFGKNPDSEQPPSKFEELWLRISPAQWTFKTKVLVTIFAVLLGSIGYFKSNLISHNGSDTDLEDTADDDTDIGPEEDRGTPIEASFKDTKGALLDLNQLRGKVLVVTFWASWCEPCLIELPTFKTMMDRINNPDFKFVAVNLDEDPDGQKAAQALWDKLKFSGNYYVDPTKSGLSAFKVETIPATFVLDKKGRIAMTTTGSNDWSNDRVIDSITELLKGH